MDMCGLHAPECLGIDDLLDFSNADLFTSTTDSNISHYHLPLPLNSSHHSASTTDADPPNTSTTFSDDLCVPSDDVAELEWLSRFVDDSFSDFPANELSGTPNFQPEPSIPGKTRSKRSRTASTWTLPPKSDIPATVKSKSKNDTNYVKKKTSSPTASSEVRRCAHCASENTPQWREGPLGPKTLCNACGVRYKSGRLVPEYRPAASPTFVLTQHSNSHRKVMELRRQKEVTALDITNHHHQFYRHPHDFQITLELGFPSQEFQEKLGSAALLHAWHHHRS